MQEDVDQCVAATDQCRAVVEALEQLSTTWEFQLVERLPGRCEGKVGACAVGNRDASGGVVYFAPSEFGEATTMTRALQDFNTLIPHEGSHPTICGMQDEGCAIMIENQTRAQLRGNGQTQYRDRDPNRY
jgi:hypothetical protein